MHDKIVNECKTSNAEQYIKTASCSAQLFTKRRHVTHSLVLRPHATIFKSMWHKFYLRLPLPSVHLYTYLYTISFAFLVHTVGEELKNSKRVFEHVSNILPLTLWMLDCVVCVCVQTIEASIANCVCMLKLS